MGDFKQRAEYVVFLEILGFSKKYFYMIELCELIREVRHLEKREFNLLLI